jgi:hypothetical protein
MDRGFVAADEHASAAEIAEVAHGMFGLLRQPQQPVRVIAKQATGIGQGRILGRAIEQAFADAFLEPPHRLADGGLGPVQLHGGTGKTALRGDLEENLKLAELHDDKQS